MSFICLVSWAQHNSWFIFFLTGTTPGLLTSKSSETFSKSYGRKNLRLTQSSFGHQPTITKACQEHSGHTDTTRRTPESPGGVGSHPQRRQVSRQRRLARGRRLASVQRVHTTGGPCRGAPRKREHGAGVAVSVSLLASLARSGSQGQPPALPVPGAFALLSRRAAALVLQAAVPLPVVVLRPPIGWTRRPAMFARQQSWRRPLRADLGVDKHKDACACDAHRSFRLCSAPLPPKYSV